MAPSAALAAGAFRAATGLSQPVAWDRFLLSQLIMTLKLLGFSYLVRISQYMNFKLVGFFLLGRNKKKCNLLSSMVIGEVRPGIGLTYLVRINTFNPFLPWLLEK